MTEALKSALDQELLTRQFAKDHGVERQDEQISFYSPSNTGPRNFNDILTGKTEKGDYTLTIDAYAGTVPGEKATEYITMTPEQARSKEYFLRSKWEDQPILQMIFDRKSLRK